MISPVNDAACFSGQVQDLAGTPPDQQPCGKSKHDFHYGEKYRIGKNRFDIGISVFTVDFFEFFVFLVLRSKSLDDLHPGDMFLYKSIQCSYRISYPDKGFVHGFLEEISSNESGWEKESDRSGSAASWTET